MDRGKCGNVEGRWKCGMADGDAGFTPIIMFFELFFKNCPHFTNQYTAIPFKELKQIVYKSDRLQSLTCAYGSSPGPQHPSLHKERLE
jgi:hypothetical protein